MLTRLRTLLFWCHLAAGVLVAAVVLTMAVTGVLLTYQRQLTAWADTRGLDGALLVWTGIALSWRRWLTWWRRRRAAAAASALRGAAA